LTSETSFVCMRVMNCGKQNAAWQQRVCNPNDDHKKRKISGDDHKGFRNPILQVIIQTFGSLQLELFFSCCHMRYSFSSSKHTKTGSTVWMTYFAGSLPAPVITASPVLQPPCLAAMILHSSSMAGPPARCQQFSNNDNTERSFPRIIIKFSIYHRNIRQIRMYNIILLKCHMRMHQ